jgi:prepilin-type processing-associated H-X9-DG protein
MRIWIGKHQPTGLTVLEVLVALIGLAILAVLLLPVTTGTKSKAPRVKCSAQLKMVTLGFALWANEHEGKLPMEMSVATGGSREQALAGNLISNFTMAAREIGDPRVLACPSDKRRKQAIAFASVTTNNISYFLNVDAAVKNQAGIFAGDRDLATNGSLMKPGLLSIPDSNAIGWANVIHKNGGNVALVDGSVHQTTSSQLRKLLDSTGITNRFIIP